MAKSQSGNASISSGGSITITFTFRVGSYVVVSDQDMYVEEDADATTGSFRVPANTLYSPGIDCLTVGVLGTGGASTMWYKGVFRTSSVDDQEIQNDRGGIDRA